MTNLKKNQESRIMNLAYRQAGHELRKKIFFLVILFLLVFGTCVGVKAVGLIINNYNYSPKSILTFVNTVGTVSNVDAGGRIQYSMKVSNPNWQELGTDLKFNLPAGFTFDKIAGQSTGLNCPNPTQINNVLTWSGCVVQPGESEMLIDIIAP